MKHFNKLKYYLNKDGISVSNIEKLHEFGLINDRGIVRYLVRKEYQERKKNKNAYIIQLELAEKYFISHATIQNYIYS